MAALQALLCPYGVGVGDVLRKELLSRRWKIFRAGVAFAKMSGVKHLDAPLRSFIAAGGRCVISVGIDQGGTSFEALSQLLGAVHQGGSVYVAHEALSGSPHFHPKVYLFSDGSPPSRVRVIVGSANLTAGGLYTNHEASFAWEPDLSKDADARATVKQLLGELDRWSSATNGLCIEVDAQGLLDLHRDGMLPTERQIAQTRQSEGVVGGRSSAKRRPGSLGGLTAQPKPKAPRAGGLGPPAVASPLASAEAEGRSQAGGGSSSRVAPSPGGSTTGRRRALHRVLVIDINQGQSKTECFLAKAPIEEDPGFFGWSWRFTGLTQPKSSRGAAQPCWTPVVELALRDARGVVISPPGRAEIRMVRHVNPRPDGRRGSEDLRLGVPADMLHRLTEGCILKMHRKPSRNVEYLLEFLTPGSPQWSEARAVAVQPLPGSPRKFGWI